MSPWFSYYWMHVDWCREEIQSIQRCVTLSRGSVCGVWSSGLHLQSTVFSTNLHYTHSSQSHWTEKHIWWLVSKQQLLYGEGKFSLSTWFILRWLSKIWKSSWMLGTYPDCNLDQIGTSFNEISKAPVERKWVSSMLLMKKTIRQENILFSCPQNHILGVFVPNIWKGFCPVTIKAMASNLK